jgi:hypothetical protein
MAGLQVPVVVIIFNRPGATRRVVNAIAEVQPRQLFVIADGPRTDRAQDASLVAAARAVIDGVDWECEVHRCYSEVNLGCHVRIATGLDWVFDQVDQAIIVEDDCVPDRSFFSYCEELLARYQDDARVQMISGCNVVGAKTTYSYHFSRCYHIWGWATWSRAWTQYDEGMALWPRLRETDWLEDRLGDSKGARIAHLFFDAAYSREMPQWDFYWAFNGWLRDALSVMPSVNLVKNIGYGAEATHQRDAGHPFANLPAEAMAFPLRHPPDIEVFQDADRAIWEATFALFPQFQRRRPWALLARSAHRAGQVLRRRG